MEEVEIMPTQVWLETNFFTHTLSEMRELQDPRAQGTVFFAWTKSSPFTEKDSKEISDLYKVNYVHCTDWTSLYPPKLQFYKIIKRSKCYKLEVSYPPINNQIIYNIPRRTEKHLYQNQIQRSTKSNENKMAEKFLKHSTPIFFPLRKLFNP